MLAARHCPADFLPTSRRNFASLSFRLAKLPLHGSLSARGFPTQGVRLLSQVSADRPAVREDRT